MGSRSRGAGCSARPTRASSLSTRGPARPLWGHKLTNRHEQFVDIAPLAARGLVFTSTVGFAPSGRGALYALDQRTGKLRWRFDTIRDPWPYPSAGGGGAWYSPSLAPDGRLYFGISNPGPWGGSPVRPNGGMFPGPTPYTDALLTLTAGTGRLLWYDQVTKHDVRDYDLEASPIVVGRSVYGAGKSGRVVAWDRVSGKRQWTQMVGTHVHDLGPLPRKPTLVCPGLWGGVLTPMAYADGRLFVPVVERCMHESSVDPAYPADLRKGDGVLYARLGAHRPQALVPAARSAGDRLRDRRERCRVRAEPRRPHPRRCCDRTAARCGRRRPPAGINGCPSVARRPAARRRRRSAPLREQPRADRLRAVIDAYVQCGRYEHRGQ